MRVIVWFILLMAVFRYGSFNSEKVDKKNSGPDNKISAKRQMENLQRGIIAVYLGGDSVFVGWRLLGTDPETTAFNIYRITNDGNPKKLNNDPLISSTNYIDNNVDTSLSHYYFVKPLVNGKESDPSEKTQIWQRPYISVPITKRDGYRPGDGSVGDLDGDGEYELVIHMSGRGRDNSHPGLTSAPILEAYEFDGTLMWTINLGKNIREGAHYTQFMVYDLDGDGRAEVACKTSDGTLDGKGNIIGNSDSLYAYTEGTTIEITSRGGSLRKRTMDGFIVRGPEYLTIFDGKTGAELVTTDYIPPRHPETMYPTVEQMTELWGDGVANRSDRFLACVAYLDGKRPSLIMCRGYYTRSVLAAWNYRGGKLTHLWTFDSKDGTPGNDAYSGQGNHNLSVGDVDNDGKDEIIYGACVIDHDGSGLYSTGFGHGDALHFSDLDPENPGLEIFNIQERFDDAGMNFREAGTGKVLWKVASAEAEKYGSDRGEGPGRANAFNVDPRYPGAECWVRGAGLTKMYNAKGEVISERAPRLCNFAVWWDGDLLRELLDRNFIAKWNWEKMNIDTLFQAEECWYNNGSKATPVLSADLFGDWREEVIWRTRDNSELRIYTTTIPSDKRFITLMHDPVYRLGIAWQNVAYNQPPHTGYYIGDDMEKPLRYEIYTP